MTNTCEGNKYEEVFMLIQVFPNGHEELYGKFDTYGQALGTAKAHMKFVGNTNYRFRIDERRITLVESRMVEPE